jgi:pSer/pThr/pTyr-binding forkhead associated (FHA) protein
MTTIPYISVQLIHIQGPLKGEIQTFTDSEIRIGRHPDCEVQFPKDVVTLSRQHARIVREGNRFKLIDQSTNGSYVNGQRVTEAYLKDGDVITFSEGGPKVSFLTQTSQQAPAQPVNSSAQTQPAYEPQPSAAPQPYAVSNPSPPPQAHKTPPPAAAPSAPAAPKPQISPSMGASGVAIEKVKAPLAIQYGPALKSFQTLPITIGKGPGCDFVINHPALNDQQAQIFFAQERYWIKDLTGSLAISLNGNPVQLQAPLEADMQIALSPQGPRFRFLGGGRLAEIEDPQPEQAPAAPPVPPPQPAAPEPKEKSDNLGQKAGTLFKKFFR